MMAEHSRAVDGGRSVLRILTVDPGSRARRTLALATPLPETLLLGSQAHSTMLHTDSGIFCFYSSTQIMGFIKAFSYIALVGAPAPSPVSSDFSCCPSSWTVLPLIFRHCYFLFCHLPEGLAFTSKGFLSSFITHTFTSTHTYIHGCKN